MSDYTPPWLDAYRQRIEINDLPIRNKPDDWPDLPTERFDAACAENNLMRTLSDLRNTKTLSFEADLSPRMGTILGSVTCLLGDNTETRALYICRELVTSCQARYFGWHNMIGLDHVNDDLASLPILVIANGSLKAFGAISSALFEDVVLSRHEMELTTIIAWHSSHEWFRHAITATLWHKIDFIRSDNA